MRSLFDGGVTAVTAGAAVIVGLGATGAVAAGVIGSGDVRNQSIRAVDIHRGAIGASELRGQAVRREHIEDGSLAVPGNGRNSEATWDGDAGTALQQSWVRCAEGKAAVGGGFARGDEGASALGNLQIVTSSPAQVGARGTVVPVTGGDTPIEGDVAGSDVPNGWVVEGFNNGATDLVVRPYVVCAEVEDAAEEPEEPEEPEEEGE